MPLGRIQVARAEQDGKGRQCQGDVEGAVQPPAAGIPKMQQSVRILDQ